MWEEQSHRECSPEKDAYGLDKYRCNLATLNRPGQPDQPTTGGGPRTVTITTRQAATLIASGSGITRQPPGPKVIISKAFIVYTNPTVRYQTTTILGTPIEVEFTPTSYTWGWGDGTTTTTTDPGAPYPHQTVTHHYQHTATGVTTTLTTTWTTRYRPAGESQWRPLEGTTTPPQHTPTPQTTNHGMVSLPATFRGPLTNDCLALARIRRSEPHGPGHVTRWTAYKSPNMTPRPHNTRSESTPPVHTLIPRTRGLTYKFTSHRQESQPRNIGRHAANHSPPLSYPTKSKRAQHPYSTRSPGTT